VVTDDFERSAESDSKGTLGTAVWENAISGSGSWGIVNGEVVPSLTAATGVLINKTVKLGRGSESRFVLRTDVKGMVDNTWAGVAFNVQDARNYYYLRFKANTGSYQMIRVMSGTETRMGDAGKLPAGIFETGKAYTLMVGSSKPHEFSFGITDASTGNLLASGVRNDDAMSFSGGYAGLCLASGGDKARFDNFNLSVEP
jgi:hypothetical protein